MKRFTIILPLMFICFALFGQDTQTNNLPTLPLRPSMAVFELLRGDTNWDNIKKVVVEETKKERNMYLGKASPLSLTLFDYSLSSAIISDMGFKDAFYENLLKNSKDMLNKHLDDEVVFATLFNIGVTAGSTSPFPFERSIQQLEKIVAKSPAVSLISSFPNGADENMLNLTSDALSCHFNTLAQLLYAYADAQRRDDACKTLKKMTEYLKSLTPVGADTAGLSQSLYAEFTPQIQNMESMESPIIEPFRWVRAAIQETIPFMVNFIGCDFRSKKEE